MGTLLGTLLLPVISAALAVAHRHYCCLGCSTLPLLLQLLPLPLLLSLLPHLQGLPSFPRVYAPLRHYVP